MAFSEQPFSRIYTQNPFYHKRRRVFVFAILVFFILFLAFPVVAHASDSSVDVYFFRGEGCPHCAKEEKFFAQLEDELSWINVNEFEVWYDRENAVLLKKISEVFRLNVSGVPVTFIGDKVFTGYSDDETSGEAMRSAIEICYQEQCPDIVGEFIAGETGNKGEDVEQTEQVEQPKQSEEAQQTEQNDKDGEHARGSIADTPTLFHIPLFGEVEATSLSLPVLTVVIAGLDGFNPCAMWVLIYLVGLLLGIKNTKRRWVLGLTFIAASATVYFLFMAAWLNFLLFVGFIVWIRIGIGGGAVGVGLYSIRKFFKNPVGVCEVSKDGEHRKIFEKLRDVTRMDNLFLALGGIIVLAFAINLVELMCSAGFPAIYTHVLTLSRLSALQYYLYLLFYVFVFMLDDMVVFFIAMITLRTVGIDGRYSRYSGLVGGIIILILGLFLIFRPQFLMFG